MKRTLYSNKIIDIIMKIKNLLLVQSLIIASFTSTFAQINTISADILPAEGGIVNGAGNYFTGSPVNLEAIPNLGYDFEYWTEDGFKISEDSLLSFICRSCDVFYGQGFAPPKHQ